MKMNLMVNGNSFFIPLKSDSVHCIVTSPPYWAMRDYGVDGQIGREKLHDCLGWATGQACGECFICHMVQVFSECYRVLRPDGTLWLNIGDTHAGSGRGASKNKGQARESYVPDPSEVIRFTSDNIQPTELMGIPWALAFALRASGWYLKEEIIWHKRNPRPESVTNRPSRDHEQLFLFSKSQKYFYDGEAVKEPTSPKTNTKGTRLAQPKEQNGVSEQGQKDWTSSACAPLPTRNIRTVWSMLSERYKGQHFATFPSKLAETCILAGTSAYGCCSKCGAPYERLTKVVGYDMQSYAPETRNYHVESTGGDKHGKNSVMNTGLVPIRQTVGWQETCSCEGKGEPVPAIVLDPFNGSGRTILAANRHGRFGVGIELNPEYIEQAKKQLSVVQMALSSMFGEG